MGKERASLQFSIRSANDVVPKLKFIDDPLTEFIRRARHRLIAQRHKPDLRLRLVQNRDDLAMKDIDDLLRRASRKEHSHPAVACNVGNPASEIVGTSGNALARALPMTARARNRP